MLGKFRVGRFWGKVNKNGPIMPNMTTPCWEWTKCRNNWNYGVTSFGKGRTLGTHKLAWILTNGEVPEGYLVLHKCDNPPCCNPEHLFIGTQSDNVRDAITKGRWGVVKVEVKTIQIEPVKQRAFDKIYFDMSDLVKSVRDTLVKQNKYKNKQVRMVKALQQIWQNKAKKCTYRYYQ